jgi:hypothetical protein
MTGPNFVCDASGKRTYFKERLANRAITEADKRGELPRLRHYRCPHCGYWHLSRKHREMGAV